MEGKVLSSPPSLQGSSPARSSCDESDVASESSTIVYDHEPFSTFKDRVLAFALTCLWPDAAADDVTVERLPGGAYNRIIGLTRHVRDGPPDVGGTKDKEQQCILRVPRFDAAQVENEVAVLKFVSSNTWIPVPRVCMFDHGQDNVLYSPFCVQERVAGASLFALFPTLSHADKVRVAQDLGRVVQSMLAVRSRSAGRFVLCKSTAGPPLDLEPFVRSTDAPAPGSSRLVLNAAPAEATPAALLMSMLAAQKAACLETHPTETVLPEILDQLSGVASDLERTGWLVAGDDHYYTLAHLDLAPRNIMADTSQTKTAAAASSLSIVSAILDWDSAVCAPPFVACAPHPWIWAEWDSDREDEPRVLPSPESTEAAQRKEVFDGSAGATFCRFAYSTEYRLARQLFRLAAKGFGTNEDFKAAELLLEEWHSLFPA
ncbi:hypothetical protein F503_06377 [Ophiostoma piceae UAMH 11346]|uniref:Aminoglycoside phosphotransferase domain-containing protein n=1 Tax=Ophiostoma piceae (strain UAMH 11346) TaxID=1262450 RepID=S3CEV1_OPHP1|nr:hypothetical protein F503_06377 [Ophiostoma piceae UAMH 11346]